MNYAHKKEEIVYFFLVVTCVILSLVQVFSLVNHLSVNGPFGFSVFARYVASDIRFSSLHSLQVRNKCTIVSYNKRTHIRFIQI